MEEKQSTVEESKREEAGGGREMILSEEKHSAMDEQHQHQLIKQYPAPLFSHKELCSDPGIFIQALRRFHSLMATKFMIPVIGGKDLNLHQLYVEVTQRGGIEKVIVEKRWREVIAVFSFPPTTTSASFVLKKYYLSLLHHFEQVYFFGARGALVPPAAALQTRTPLGKLVDMDRPEPGPEVRRKRAFPLTLLPAVQLIPRNSEERISVSCSSPHEASPQATSNAGQELPFNANEYRGSNPALLFAASSSRPTAQSPPLCNGAGGFGASCSIPPTDGSMPSATGGSYNFTVNGTIDGKFDYGYFVTVKIGSQLLHGVLYHIHQHQLGNSPSAHHPHHPSVPHPPANPVHHPPAASSFTASTMEKAYVSYIPATRSAGRRRRVKNRDPAHPKPNRSAYNFFFSEKHFALKVQYPHMEREYSKMIGDSWNKLTDEERQVYEDYARRDKERYKKEMQVYKERLKFAGPKDFGRAEEIAKEIEMARREVARREAQHCRERMEVPHPKETAGSAKNASRESREMRDCSEAARCENGARVEEKAQEFEEPVMSSAEENQNMIPDSAAENTADRG